MEIEKMKTQKVFYGKTFNSNDIESLLTIKTT